MTLYGGGPNSSDAYTINGLPGPLYPCSKKGNIGNCEAFQTLESKNVKFLHKFFLPKRSKGYFKADDPIGLMSSPQVQVPKKLRRWEEFGVIEQRFLIIFEKIQALSKKKKKIKT